MFVLSSLHFRISITNMRDEWNASSLLLKERYSFPQSMKSNSLELNWHVMERKLTQSRFTALLKLRNGDDWPRDYRFGYSNNFISVTPLPPYGNFLNSENDRFLSHRFAMCYYIYDKKRVELKTIIGKILIPWRKREAWRWNYIGSLRHFRVPIAMNLQISKWTYQKLTIYNMISKQS